MARFADRATVFHTHYAGGNFTSPGTASLLTGTYPWSHRAVNLHSTVRDEFIPNNLFRLFPGHYHKVAYTHNLLVASLLDQFQADIDRWIKPRELCLADTQFTDQLFSKDYHVGFWSEQLNTFGGGEPPNSLFLSLGDRARRYALRQQLTEAYQELFPRGVPNLHTLHFILEDAIDWLREELAALPRPFLAYFHLLPPHEPYLPRRDFIDIFQDGWQPAEKPKLGFPGDEDQAVLDEKRRQYDEYLAYTDAEFGRLLDGMVQSKLMDDTYVVLTSDHGELFERGIRGHWTETLYEPVVHVPLLISRPGQNERRDVFSRTSCVDLLPTLLAAAGQPAPAWAEGQLLPVGGEQGLVEREELEGVSAEERVIYVVEAKSNRKQAPINRATIAMLKGDYKLIRYMGYKEMTIEYELYNLSDDPQELNNLYPTAGSLAAELQEELEEKLQEVNEPYREING
jgi:arylsulfatase A-like enzyme